MEPAAQNSQDEARENSPSTTPRKLPPKLARDNARTGLSSEQLYALDHFHRRTTEIRTHRHVDVDAAFSVALWGHIIGKPLAECSISFNGGRITEDSQFIGIDVHGGCKGRRSSAFEELFFLLQEPDRSSLADLRDHITAQDQAKLHAYPSHVQAGFLAKLIENKHIAKLSDLQICLWAEQELQMYIRAGTHIAQLREVADRAQLFGQGLIALVDSDDYTVQEILFNRGVGFVVYESGNNVGAKRSPKISEPHLGKLLSTLEGTKAFYAEENGFLFCSGSKKAPAGFRPSVSGLEIAQALEQHLQTLARGH